MAKTKPDLSIIILNWNTETLLRNCLNSIISNLPRGKAGVQNSNLQIELIVVDNASTDGSREYLKKLENYLRQNSTSHSEFISESQTSRDILNPAILKQVQDDKLKFEVIFNDRNLGFAKGNNQGIKQAKGKYILLLNSDTEIKPNSIQTLINYLNQHPKTTAVSPMLLNMDGSKQIDYYMKFPNFWQMIFYHNGILRPIAMHTPIKNLLIQTEKGQPFSVDQLPGAALMAAKQTFNQIGGLDEDFDFLFEDVDWCYRVKEKHHGKLMVVPQAEIMHVGGASWKKKLVKNRFDFYNQYFKSLFKFVDKHYPQKKLILKFGLAFSLITNSLAHIITLRLKKAKTQVQLIKSLAYDF